MTALRSEPSTRKNALFTTELDGHSSVCVVSPHLQAIICCLKLLKMKKCKKMIEFEFIQDNSGFIKSLLPFEIV